MPIGEPARLRYKSRVTPLIITVDLYLLELQSMSRNLRQIWFPVLALLVILSTLLSACGPKTASSDHELAMASLVQMPADVKNAPVTVQQAYQFNVANPELLKQIPCYCGCGSMGHTSNYACYVTDVGGDGKINYDTHALGCSICVDITQDTMRLLRQGKTVPEIRAYVDQTYSKYGPSNMP